MGLDLGEREDGMGREIGEVGERGNYGWDWVVMHERIIIKINKQTKNNVPPTRLIKN